MSQATLPDRPYVNSNLFSGHYLDERVQDRADWDCDDAAQAAMEELQSLHDSEGAIVEGYNEDGLIDNWIDEVLDVLGFGTQEEVTLPDGTGHVDELLFEDETTRREAASLYLQTESTADVFEHGIGILEAKQWDADFTTEFSERRQYRNASHQIKHYLEKTPGAVQWGILTNGRKWRLYGTKDYETQTYYEIDLPELLERGDLEAFKYFYVFFRPAAFRTSGGTTFLDDVRSESETAAQQLGDDLQDNVFTALRVLGRGFVETNDLAIDPDDDVALEDLKEQSLVMLYRLMFVLYAEARGLIHPDDSDAQSEYEQNFSLDALRLEIHDEIGEVDTGFEAAYSEHSTTMWNRLSDLFQLIDEGQADLGIPPYNGGLFDHDKHDFLTEHEVSDRYLAEVIYRLSTTENDAGRYVLADYADLDTRHLGSVYEGLLEHEFRIAPEQYAAVAADGGQVWEPASEVTVADAVETVPAGGLYVVNDEGERKATGAYYTPDYVVTYIVEETIGPLLDEIHDDLESQGFERGTQAYVGPFIRRVTDLEILDPAMGSGHFLTRATEYLANEVMAELRDVETEMGVAIDEQQMRRDIAKECIYGVDINGMAVELAKLSMWLETLATDQPLAFLDHHLKVGNSLVGSDVTEVLSEDDDGDGQLTLTQAFGRVRRDTLDHVMDLMGDLLAMDNETLEDIHSMEDLYAEIQDDPLYRRLFELTNVHTATQFGVDVPDDAYEQMADAIEDESEWAAIQGEDWFEDAQALADEQTFFHWELEYPGVFFDEDGEERSDAGFDAVIGNPPWMDFQRIGDESRTYQRSRYTAAEGKYDLYTVFVERGITLTSGKGNFGYIIQNKFLSSEYGEGLRKFLVEKTHIRNLLDFEDAPIFEGTTTYPLILVTAAKRKESFEYVHLREATERDVIDCLNELGSMSTKVESKSLDPEKPWIFPTREERKVVSRIQENGVPLNELTVDISTGIKTNYKEAYVFEDEKAASNIEGELLKPVLDGGDIRRFSPTDIDKRLLYPYREDLEPIDLAEYPGAAEHLRKCEEELRDRRFYEKSIEEMDKEWFEFPYTSENLLSPKLLFPDISPEPRATFDPTGETLILNTAYGAVLRDDIDLDIRFICALFNSSPLRFMFTTLSPVLSGGYYRFQTQYVGQLPIKPIELEHDEQWRTAQCEDLVYGTDTSPEHYTSEVLYQALIELADQYMSEVERRGELNVVLLDHLGSYSDGPTLADVGLTQPPEGAADSILTQTTEERPNLRVGAATVVRESSTAVEIRLTARYKPDEPDNHETDQWGYTETEPLPALRISDLAEAEADLIEHFVPVAVDEAGGFAEFRETATKTNSLVDRLRKLTLPAVEDVREGLDSYVETKARADELEEKIDRTDALIDEIVYELYGLTDEEIEIVEEAVGD